MGIYGYIWVYMSIYGYIWVYMSIFEYIWVYMSIYEYIWVYMCIYGYIWVYMVYIAMYRYIGIYEYIWVYMSIYWYILTRLFKNRKCPEAKNSLGWCLVMILPNLSHFESLTKRCLALRNRPFRPFCDSQHQTEIFLNAQHLFLSESKWLKFGTSITE